MELPKIGKSDRGMFDGIKSKLGFATDSGDDYGDEAYYDDSEADYGEYGADYSGDDSYGQGYESYDDPAPSNRRSNYGSERSSSGSPRLVSIDDVRSRTQIPDSLNRDPLPERRVSGAQTSAYVPASTASGQRSGFQPRSSRTVEHASDYLLSSETSDLVERSESSRPNGYDSLFSPTDSSSVSAFAAASATAASSQNGSSRSYDPYETFAGTGVTSHNPSRSLTVLKPVSYGEVERIAKILKAGDVVALSLRNTPDHLAKRILDFSFGVSSALDASVECVADKVFVIVRGRALSTEEQMSLRNQGVL